MKKQGILLLMFVVFSAGNVFGQTNRFDIGIEAGGGLASLRDNDSYKEYGSSDIGFLGGVVVQYNFPKLISIRTGLFIDQKRINIDFPLYGVPTQEPENIRMYYHFNYLTIPLLARLTFGKKIKFYTDIGPSLSHLTKVEFGFDGSGESADFTTYYKKWSIGLSGGLGGGIEINRRMVGTIELRHTMGLNDINDPEVSRAKTKISSTNLLVGVVYRLGKRSEK